MPVGFPTLSSSQADFITGWANYINGDLTPITLLEDVSTDLTMDSGSGTVNEEYLPDGVSGLWDSTNNAFDFSSLKVGDMVDIRIDGFITTTGINTSFSLDVIAGFGSPSQFTFPFASGGRFLPSSNSVSRYNGIFIGSEDVLNYPAKIVALATSASTAYLVDIYIKVTRPCR